MSWNPQIIFRHKRNFKTAKGIQDWLQQSLQMPIIEADFDNGFDLLNYTAAKPHLLFFLGHGNADPETEWQKEKVLEFRAIWEDDADEIDIWVCQNCLHISVGMKRFPYSWGEMIRAMDELLELRGNPAFHKHPFHHYRAELARLMRLLGCDLCLLYCSDANPEMNDAFWEGATVESVLEKFAERWDVIDFPRIASFRRRRYAPYYDRSDDYPEEVGEFGSFVMLDDFRDV